MAPSASAAASDSFANNWCGSCAAPSPQQEHSSRLAHFTAPSLAPPPVSPCPIFSVVRLLPSEVVPAVPASLPSPVCPVPPPHMTVEHPAPLSPLLPPFPPSPLPCSCPPSLAPSPLSTLCRSFSMLYCVTRSGYVSTTAMCCGTHTYSDNTMHSHTRKQPSIICFHPPEQYAEFARIPSRAAHPQAAPQAPGA